MLYIKENTNKFKIIKPQPLLAAAHSFVNFNIDFIKRKSFFPFCDNLCDDRITDDILDTELNRAKFIQILQFGASILKPTHFVGLLDVLSVTLFQVTSDDYL